MKSCVIVFTASNFDRDIADSLARATGTRPQMVWHGEPEVPACDLIVLPVGFSFGDYLRCGAIAANSPIMKDVIKKAADGTPVLGVCNGFQILVESGLLPGALLLNSSLKFICKDTHLKVAQTDTIFTRKYETDSVIRIPIAHHEGNYFADDDTLDMLEGEGRIAFRYCSAEGDISNADNPNGSARNIAGIYNKRFTVLGMMPHPERLDQEILGGVDGAPLFHSLVEALS